MKKKFLQALAVGIAALSGATPAHAQWQTQTILIKPGWSAIYVHVDASYDTLDNLVGNDHNNPIAELWMWAPPADTIQYVTSPQAPITGSQWANWERIGTGLTSTLNHLVANAAYLVHSTAGSNYTWNVKGKPMAPSYSWATTGKNFIGFPTAPGNAPRFDTFLSLAPSLQAVADIFQYQGGDLGPINPMEVFSLHTTFVTGDRHSGFGWGRISTITLGPLPPRCRIRAASILAMPEAPIVFISRTRRPPASRSK